MKKLLWVALLGLGTTLMAQAPVTGAEVEKFALILEDLQALDEEGYFDDAFDSEDNPGLSSEAMIGAIQLYGLQSTVTSRGMSVQRFGEVSVKVYAALLRWALGENYEVQIEMQAQYQAMVDQGLMRQEDVDAIMGAFTQMAEGFGDLSDAEYEAVLSHWDLLDEVLDLED
jgi:hypothetical protein